DEGLRAGGGASGDRTRIKLVSDRIVDDDVLRCGECRQGDNARARPGGRPGDVSRAESGPTLLHAPPDSALVAIVHASHGCCSAAFERALERRAAAGYRSPSDDGAVASSGAPAVPGRSDRTRRLAC